LLLSSIALAMGSSEVTLITAVLFYISILCIDAHIDGFSVFNSLLLTLFLVIIMFVVYQLLE
ncbi:hypothetical protein, partial [Klebsiella aerogenes]|uniref:hypothetical protein n=1 Tax=Klebsiella aerogenes TaxID=548 RepID=UPI001953BC4F